MSAQSSKKKRFGSRRRVTNPNKTSEEDEFVTTDSNSAQRCQPEENITEDGPEKSLFKAPSSPEITESRRKLGSSRRNKGGRHGKISETDGDASSEKIQTLCVEEAERQEDLRNEQDLFSVRDIGSIYKEKESEDGEDRKSQGSVLESESNLESAVAHFSVASEKTTEENSREEDLKVANLETAGETVSPFIVKNAQRSHNDKDREQACERPAYNVSDTVHSEPSEVISGDWTCQSEVSDSYQTESKSTDNSLEHKGSNPESKQDEHHNKESHFEALAGRGEDLPHSDPDMAETTDETDGSARYIIKANTEPTEKDLSCIAKSGQMLQSGQTTPSDSQLQDNTVSTYEDSDMSYNPLVNRRKLGSSRRNKGRHVVKESNHKAAQDEGEDFQNKACNKAELLSIETSVENMLKETGKSVSQNTEETVSQINPTQEERRSNYRGEEGLEMLKQVENLQGDNNQEEEAQGVTSAETTIDHKISLGEDFQFEFSHEKVTFSTSVEEQSTKDKQMEVCEEKGAHEDEYPTEEVDITTQTNEHHDKKEILSTVDTDVARSGKNPLQDNVYYDTTVGISQPSTPLHLHLTTDDDPSLMVQSSMERPEEELPNSYPESEKERPLERELCLKLEDVDLSLVLEIPTESHSPKHFSGPQCSVGEQSFSSSEEEILPKQIPNEMFGLSEEPGPLSSHKAVNGYEEEKAQLHEIQDIPEIVAPFLIEGSEIVSENITDAVSDGTDFEPEQVVKSTDDAASKQEDQKLHVEDDVLEKQEGEGILYEDGMVDTALQTKQLDIGQDFFAGSNEEPNPGFKSIGDGLEEEHYLRNEDKQQREDSESKQTHQEEDASALSVYSAVQPDNSKEVQSPTTSTFLETDRESLLCEMEMQGDHVGQRGNDQLEEFVESIEVTHNWDGLKSHEEKFDALEKMREQAETTETEKKQLMIPECMTNSEVSDNQKSQTIDSDLSDMLEGCQRHEINVEASDQRNDYHVNNEKKPKHMDYSVKTDTWVHDTQSSVRDDLKTSSEQACRQDKKGFNFEAKEGNSSPSEVQTTFSQYQSSDSKQDKETTAQSDKPLEECSVNQQLKTTSRPTDMQEGKLSHGGSVTKKKTKNREEERESFRPEGDYAERESHFDSEVTRGTSPEKDLILDSIETVCDIAQPKCSSSQDTMPKIHEQIEPGNSDTVDETEKKEEEVQPTQMQETNEVDNSSFKEIESSSPALQSEMIVPTDSQPDRIEGFNLIGNRRKLGSSRRKNGRQQVKDTMTVTGNHYTDNASNIVHEQEVKTTKIQDSNRVPESVVCNATKIPEIMSEDLMEEAEVSDIYKSELALKRSYDSLSNQEEPPQKEIKFESLDDRKDEYHVNDTKTPQQISDTDPASYLQDSSTETHAPYSEGGNVDRNQGNESALESNYEPQKENQEATEVSETIAVTMQEKPLNTTLEQMKPFESAQTVERSFQVEENVASRFGISESAALLSHSTADPELTTSCKSTKMQEEEVEGGGHNITGGRRKLGSSAHQSVDALNIVQEPEVESTERKDNGLVSEALTHNATNIVQMASGAQTEEAEVGDIYKPEVAVMMSDESLNKLEEPPAKEINFEALDQRSDEYQAHDTKRPQQISNSQVEDNAPGEVRSIEVHVEDDIKTSYEQTEYQDKEELIVQVQEKESSSQYFPSEVHVSFSQNREIEIKTDKDADADSHDEPSEEVVQDKPLETTKMLLTAEQVRCAEDGLDLFDSALSGRDNGIIEDNACGSVSELTSLPLPSSSTVDQLLTNQQLQEEGGEDDLNRIGNRRKLGSSRKKKGRQLVRDTATVAHQTDDDLNSAHEQEDEQTQMQSTVLSSETVKHNATMNPEIIPEHVINEALDQSNDNLPRELHDPDSQEQNFEMIKDRDPVAGSYIEIPEDLHKTNGNESPIIAKVSTVIETEMQEKPLDTPDSAQTEEGCRKEEENAPFDTFVGEPTSLSLVASSNVDHKLGDHSKATEMSGEEDGIKLSGNRRKLGSSRRNKQSKHDDSNVAVKDAHHSGNRFNNVQQQEVKSTEIQNIDLHSETVARNDIQNPQIMPEDLTHAAEVSEIHKPEVAVKRSDDSLSRQEAAPTTEITSEVSDQRNYDYHINGTKKPQQKSDTLGVDNAPGQAYKLELSVEDKIINNHEQKGFKEGDELILEVEENFTTLQNLSSGTHANVSQNPEIDSKQDKKYDCESLSSPSEEVVHNLEEGNLLETPKLSPVNTIMEGMDTFEAIHREKMSEQVKDNALDNTLMGIPEVKPLTVDQQPINESKGEEDEDSFKKIVNRRKLGSSRRKKGCLHDKDIATEISIGPKQVETRSTDDELDIKTPKMSLGTEKGEEDELEREKGGVTLASTAISSSDDDKSGEDINHDKQMIKKELETLGLPTDDSDMQNISHHDEIVADSFPCDHLEQEPAYQVPDPEALSCGNDMHQKCFAIETVEHATVDVNNTEDVAVMDAPASGEDKAGDNSEDPTRKDEIITSQEIPERFSTSHNMMDSLAPLSTGLEVDLRAEPVVDVPGKSEISAAVIAEASQQHAEEQTHDDTGSPKQRKRRMGSNRRMMTKPRHNVGWETNQRECNTDAGKDGEKDKDPGNKTPQVSQKETANPSLSLVHQQGLRLGVPDLEQSEQSGTSDPQSTQSAITPEENPSLTSNTEESPNPVNPIQIQVSEVNSEEAPVAAVLHSGSPKQELMSETESGGRRRKFGSNRKTPAKRSNGSQTAKGERVMDEENGSDGESVTEEGTNKTTVGESSGPTVSQVEDLKKKAARNLSTSETREDITPVSLTTSKQVSPAQHLPAEIQPSREDEDRLPLGGNFIEAGGNSRRYNVVMIGDSSVGKTCFMNRARSGKFSSQLPASVGLDSCLWTVVVQGNPMPLQLWDTAGQERFHSITRQILHKAQAFLLMYDITSSQSFSAVSYWASCIQEGAAENVAVLLLGNKSDHAERQVKTQQGEALAKVSNFGFMECSAATGENVIQALESVARMLSENADMREETTVMITEQQQKKKSSGCC